MKRNSLEKRPKKEGQLKKFFGTLFKGSEGYIELRTINNDDVRQFFYHTNQIDRLVSHLFNDDLFKNTNTYFGVSPRAKKQGKEEYVKQVNCLWADLDCKGEKERQERLQKLKNFKLPPSIIVNSGHGYHVYWLLSQPYLIKTNQDKLDIKGYIKGLSIALNGDRTFDLSRILRVPGSKNIKDPDNLLPVEILEFKPALRYKLTEFEQFEVDVEDVRLTVDISPDEIPDRFWRILGEDSKLKTTWEGKRTNLKDDTRSGYDMALANLLIPYGFSDSEIAAILKDSPSGKGQDAKPQYLSYTIGKARASWNKNKLSQKEKPPRIKFNPRPYSLEVLSNNFLKYDEYKRFWIYDKTVGIWRDKAELILNSDLRKKILGDKDYKRYCVGEILADLQGLTWIDEIPEEPEPYLVPFKNKIYDLKNNELLDYSPDCFFINKLATNINEENKECPTIDKIFRELVAPEDLITLYEIPAYCLYRRYPYPKIFILYGSGANGKGVYVQILTKLLGKGNISLATSEDLQSNRFASSQLFGKLLNVSGEMDYAILKKTSMLKRCCGEDLINCERKFRDPFSFTNYAKMMFLTNQVPLTSDKTYAFYRRIFLLEFPNKFILGENADSMIVNKMPEEEFEGLAWRCLEKAKELYNKGFVFKHHEKTEEVTKKYEDLSSPLNKFLEEYTVKNIDGDIAVGDLNERYLSYLKEKGFRVWTDKEINKVMKDKGFRQKTLHTIEDGRDTTYRAWLELRWK